MLLLLLEKTVY
jgi:hypothetical protein